MMFNKPNAEQMKFDAALRNAGHRLHEAEDLGTLIEIRDWLSEVIEQEKPSSPEPLTIGYDPRTVGYNRDVLVDVIMHHWPTSTSGCSGCDVMKLGEGYPEHVADVYEQTVS